MSTPTQFKSGQFYGDLQHSSRASTFDIRRLTATRSEDEVATHRHDDAHFVFVLSGTYISSALHAPSRAPAPTLVYNPAGTVHRDRFLDGKGRFMTLSFDPAALAGAGETRAAQESARVLAQPGAISAALRITQEIGAGRDDAALEAGAWELLARLDLDAPLDQNPLPGWAHLAYDAVMDMATDHHLRIADLAAEVGVHPVHLARVFRKSWDCSPGDLLRWRRIERAIALLRQKDLCMAEIALSSGFADQSHMTRAFQSQCGMSPSRYRSRMFQSFKKTACTPD